MCCIMRQCFDADNSYRSWLGLTKFAFKGGMSQLISEPYEYNMTLTAIFSKTYSEDTLPCPHKYYISPDRWQTNMDLLQGKKVSILPPGDVNSGPVTSRRGLLEADPIVR
jgi:hypothetical protein